jgi:hypothetical protein
MLGRGGPRRIINRLQGIATKYLLYVESCRGCPRILDGCSGRPRKSGLIVNKFAGKR